MPPPKQSKMSKKSVNRSKISQGASTDTSPTFSGPTIQTEAAQAAPVNKTTAAPSASPPRDDENASTSIKRSAPKPTTMSGDKARAIDMGRSSRLRLGRRRGRDGRRFRPTRRQLERSLVKRRRGIHIDARLEVALDAVSSASYLR